MANSSQTPQDPRMEEEINIRQLIENYVQYWKFFLISIGVAVFLAFVYLRYTPTIYEVRAKILLHEKDKAGGELVGLFEEAGFSGGSSAYVSDQMDVMKSRRILRQVIVANSLNIRYYAKGRVKEAEIMSVESPLRLILMEEGQNPELETLSYEVQVKLLNENKLELTESGDGEKREVELGRPFDSPIGQLMFIPQSNFTEQIGSDMIISYRPINLIIGDLSEELELVPNKDNQSYIVNLSMRSVLPQKAERTIDSLIKKYNDDIRRDRSRVIDATTEFITERLKIVNEDLKEADRHVAQFKETQQITNIGQEASLFLESADETNKKLIAAETQLRLAEMLREKVKEGEFDLLPSNLGLEDGSIEQSIRKFNELLLERDDLLQTATANNPIVLNLNQSLDGLIRTLTKSLDNYKSSLEVKVESLTDELEKYRGRLASVPGHEEDFKPIMRRQQIVETLYLFLLQKREESDIKGAAVPEILKVIDSAYTLNNPVAPKSKIILLAALILGFLVPTGLIYLKFLLDNKIHSRTDVERYLKVPIIGEVPKTEGSITHNNDKGELAEAFRILRTNLSYMLTSGENKDTSQVVFVTSTIAKEGKSFIANNLTKILSMTGKRTLLIGLDIRNPKVLQYLEIYNEYKNYPGITQYLHNPSSLTIEEMVISGANKFDFDVIHSGEIPPNPAELLMNGNFKDIIEYAKAHYDFIVVDTAPIALVSDTMAVMNYSDLTLYTVRVDYLEKEMLELPRELYEEGRLKNMAVVLNGVDLGKRGYGYYGYRYGYGYGHKEDKSFIGKLRKLFGN